MMQRAKDLIHRTVHGVRESTPLSEVYKLLKRYNIRHLPVTGDGGEAAGIISDRDLLLQASPDDRSSFPPHLKARDVMTPDPISCPAGTPLCDIAATMKACRIDSILIVEGTKMAGIVTSTDIMQAYVEEMTQKGKRPMLFNTRLNRKQAS